jgi:hypothetical protein
MNKSDFQNSIAAENEISLAELINIFEKSPYSLKELQSLVIDWAAERNMLNKDAAKNQYEYIYAESGEMVEAKLKLKKDGLLPLIDGIGDTLVTLIVILAQLEKPQFLEVGKADTRVGDFSMLMHRFVGNYFNYDYVACAEITQSIAHLYNLNPTDCLWYAYQIISKRKGYTTTEGTFIKDEQPQIVNELPQYEID